MVRPRDRRSGRLPDPPPARGPRRRPASGEGEAMSTTAPAPPGVAGNGVIVTGGASGLGLAYGKALAEHGARVTLIDVDGDTVAAQAARLRGDGLDVRGAAADVTDRAALDRVIDDAAAVYGRLDVAFANAGIDPGPGFLSFPGGSGPPRPAGGAAGGHHGQRL